MIRLRWRQFRRNTGDMNPLLWLFAAIIALAFLTRLQAWAACNPDGWYVALGAGLTLYGIHQSRSDLRFMQHLSRRPQWIWVGEYLIFSLPFSLLLLSAANWQATLLWWLCCLSVPFTPVRRAQVWPQVFWGRLLPAALYEWISGMRKFGIFILLLYAFAFVSVFFLPYAALFFFWLLLSFLACFYQECESHQLLSAAELPARQYLHKKIRLHISFACMVGLPVYLVYILFYPDQIWVVLVFLILSSIMHLFFILNKYATYRPNRKIGGSGILQSLVMLSVVIPFLVPLPLILCFRDYGRAVRNLDFYIAAH